MTKGTPDRVVDDIVGGGGANVEATVVSPLPLPVTVETPAGDSAMDEVNDAIRVNVVAGGAGGGAVTVADGADVNAGSTTDAAVVTDVAGTLSGKLRGLVKWAFERMPSSLGQKLMTASLPVVIASDQSAVPVSGTVATQSQKAEDTPHVSGDTGEFVLGVVNTAGASILAADGDYAPFGTDNRGRIGVTTLGGTFDVLSAVNADDFTASDGRSDVFKGWRDIASNEVEVPVRPYLYNGTTWDRIRGDITNGLDVDVTRLPSLPAGNNNIGDVDIASIAAGDNNIGNVDVVTLPSIPAGNNNIGDVDVASIAAGTTRIGGTYIISGQIIDNDGDLLTVKVKDLLMTTATTTDIVAAVATKKIRVIGWEMNTNEPATVTDVNFVTGAGTTRVTGSPIVRLSADNLRAWRDASPGTFLFETVAGEALRVTQTGATDINISVIYIEV